MEGMPGNLEPIRQFMLQAISEKCEGLMLKILDSVELPIGASDVKVEEEDEEVGADDLEQENTAEEDVGLEEDDMKAEDPGEVKKRGRRKALLATYEPDKRVESWVGTFSPLLKVLKLIFPPAQS